MAPKPLMSLLLALGFVSGLAVAAVPSTQTPYASGAVLSAQKLNDDFANIEARIAAVEAAWIRQLLLNLATNAVKYTPAGGEVEIGLAQVDTQAVIRVRDTGIGIATGDLPHLFERFWRADQARTRTGDRPGTGLGLAIAKWVVDAHGGTIEVQSRPGRGTTFTVRIPTG